MRPRPSLSPARARSALGAVVLLGVLFASGCGGSGSGSDTAAARLVDPAAFEKAMAEPERVTINVHVPDEGSIEGTELAIPYDRVEERQELLPAPGTPLALYCRSGNMSAEAAETLARLGYDDIVDLEGGFLAWEASGRTILPAGSG